MFRKKATLCINTLPSECYMRKFPLFNLFLNKLIYNTDKKKIGYNIIPELKFPKLNLI